MRSARRRVLRRGGNMLLLTSPLPRYLTRQIPPPPLCEHCCADPSCCILHWLCHKPGESNQGRCVGQLPHPPQAVPPTPSQTHVVWISNASSSAKSRHISLNHCALTLEADLNHLKHRIHRISTSIKGGKGAHNLFFPFFQN